jgi:pimeloyl-ACP methyl ester carboxylesterase
MGRIAEQLLDEAVAEIVFRDPTFLERRAVGLTVTGGLEAGFTYLAKQGVLPGEVGDQPLLARILAAGVADADAAEKGAIALRPAPRRDFAPDLAEDYDRKTVDGIDYLARRKGRRWLVLINAVGVPLGLWSRLLTDPDHDYRILVVEPPGSDLVEGGMRSDAGLEIEVDRIEKVLAAEGVDRLGVVGWCSGGRVAVELAARQADRIAALVMASTSLRGAGAGESRPTQFEADVAAVFASVGNSPGSAGFLSRMLVKSQGAAPSVAEDAALFRLPRQDHAPLLTAPFASGEALVNYAARLAADREHATAEALARIKAPILAIGGAHDHIVDNAATVSVLKAHATQVASVEITGAGHYAHDLQYPYFRMLLDDAMAGRPPTSTARVS